MSQRIEPHDSLDDFPTPPWSTRALIEHVLKPLDVPVNRMSCLEPACGRGDMAKVLTEYFDVVAASDVHPYGYGDREDFLILHPFEALSVDWVITNPPFRLAAEFWEHAVTVARNGVALLCRSVFLESVDRYQRIFRAWPPTIFAPFVERVPMLRGRLDAKGSTATSYAWFVWIKGSVVRQPVCFIPPCRRQLERPGDYPIR